MVPPMSERNRPNIVESPGAVKFIFGEFPGNRFDLEISIDTIARGIANSSIDRSLGRVAATFASFIIDDRDAVVALTGAIRKFDSGLADLALCLAAFSSFGDSKEDLQEYFEDSTSSLMSRLEKDGSLMSAIDNLIMPILRREYHLVAASTGQGPVQCPSSEAFASQLGVLRDYNSGDFLSLAVALKAFARGESPTFQFAERFLNENCPAMIPFYQGSK